MDQFDMRKDFHASCAAEYLEDWKRELEKLTRWMEDTSKLYKHWISFRIIDAYSPLGLWKRIRHRFYGIPAFIVDNKRVHTGWNTDRLELLIDEQIREDTQRIVQMVKEKRHFRCAPYSGS